MSIESPNQKPEQPSEITKVIKERILEILESSGLDDTQRQMVEQEMKRNENGEGDSENISIILSIIAAEQAK